MKIDELKGYIELNEAFGYIDCNRYDEEFEIITDALKELLWYREQDLIKRRDVIPKPKYCKSHNIAECRNTSCPNCWEKTIMQIPKAEPEKKETINEKRAKYGLAPIPQWKPPKEER